MYVLNRSLVKILFSYFLYIFEYILYTNIWFLNCLVLFPSKSVDQTLSMSATSHLGDPNYGFVYIAHPRAVTQLSWRKTSKYMPK